MNHPRLRVGILNTAVYRSLVQPITGDRITPCWNHPDQGKTSPTLKRNRYRPASPHAQTLNSKI
ncbi:MAG: hypothetical protein SNJ57_06950 [Cyanobacteriota bacterium]